MIFSSRNQSVIAQSSTETEYIAANEAVKELVWILQLLDELGYKYRTPPLFMDNQSTIKQIQNTDTKRRSKHIELNYYYVRILAKDKIFLPTYIPTGKEDL